MKSNKRNGIIGLLITLICIGVFGYFGYDTMDDIKLGDRLFVLPVGLYWWFYSS